MFTIAPQSNTPITIDPFKIKQPFQKHYPAKGEELGEFINEVEDDFEDDETEYPLDYQSNSNQSNPNNIEIEEDLNSDDELDEDDEDDYVTIEDEADDDEIVTSLGY